MKLRYEAIIKVTITDEIISEHDVTDKTQDILDNIIINALQEETPASEIGLESVLKIE